MVNRRNALAAIMAMGTAAKSLAQSTYPQRPIKMIVPYGAGGSADITARIYADLLGHQLQQAVIIQNKPGAGGNIGTDAVAKAAPDGYTIGLTTSGPMAVNGSLYGRLPFDPVKDLSTLSIPGQNSSVLVVKGDSSFRTVADLVAFARMNPQKVIFVSSGVGTTAHLTAAWLRESSGTDMLHIPYKEGSQAVTALLAGDATFMFYHLSALQSHLKSGSLRALAVTASTRLAAIAQVPTMIESGFPGFDLAVWYALIAPAGMDPAVLATLRNAASRVLTAPGQDRLSTVGLEAMPTAAVNSDPAKFVESEGIRWARIVTRTGAKVDN